MTDATGAMSRRRIGTDGPETSLLSLGSWHTYDRMDFHEGVELLRRAFDAGITFFDVAVYGGVALEPGGPVRYSYTDVIFGRLIEKAGIARSDIAVSEKLWLGNFPDQPLAEQLDRALDRVGTDYADFAVLGDIRTDDLDMRRVVEQLAELVRDGKLRAWGVNNWSVADIQRARDIAAAESWPGPQMAQLKYSICRRAMADSEPYRRMFSETGISLQASDIFEGGMLAGKPQPDRMIGRDPGGIRDAIRDAAPKVTSIAAEFDATPAQLAIAFCLGHPALVTVLFGASSMKQLEENLGALELHERHGDAIRERVADLWLDGAVD